MKFTGDAKMNPVYKITLVLLLVVSLMGSFPISATVAEGPKQQMILSEAGSWLEGFEYRRPVTTTAAAGAGSKYQVFLNVTYDSDMQIDFDDLRYTDNDGITELAYWIEESYDSSFALVWVNVTDDITSGGSFFEYYGNASVSTTSSGSDTFLFYEDWSTQSISWHWDVVENTGVTISYDDTHANHGYVIRLVGSGTSTIYHIESKTDVTAPTATIFRSHIENTVSTFQRLRQGLGFSSEACGFIQSSDGIEEFWVNDDDANSDPQSMTSEYFNSYWRFEITRDGTEADLYANHTLIETGSCDPDILSNSAHSIYVRDTEYELYNDWIVVRKWVSSEPVATIGDEEIERVWNDIDNPAVVYFSVPFDMWGMDTALIIMGLVMIPTSTIYLAYGVKHDRSNDRLFYGLIILFLGCGLLIGGVMP